MKYVLGLGAFSCTSMFLLMSYLLIKHGFNLNVFIGLAFSSAGLFSLYRIRNDWD